MMISGGSPMTQEVSPRFLQSDDIVGCSWGGDFVVETHKIWDFFMIDI